MKEKVFILLLFCCYQIANGQVNKCPEEIAFAHLLNLIKTDWDYQKLEFTTKGKIDEYGVSYLDSFLCKPSFAYSVIKNPLGENILITEKRVKKFKLPIGYTNPKKCKPVRIYQYYKIENYYYVNMNFQNTGFSGYNLTLILNSNGDLICKCLSDWII